MEKTDKDFEEFWKNYPKRGGPPNKSGALASFKTKVKQGVKPERMIAAAKVYAMRRDWIGPGYYQPGFADRLIPMAQTWLNQRRYEDYEGAVKAVDETEFARLKAKYDEKQVRQG